MTCKSHLPFFWTKELFANYFALRRMLICVNVVSRKIHRGAAECRYFDKLSRIHAAQVCDARDDDSSTAAG